MSNVRPHESPHDLSRSQNSAASRRSRRRSCDVGHLVGHPVAPNAYSFSPGCGYGHPCAGRGLQRGRYPVVSPRRNNAKPYEARGGIVAGQLGHLSVDTKSNVRRSLACSCRVGGVPLFGLGVARSRSVHALHWPLSNRTRRTRALLAIRQRVRRLQIKSA